jgi:superfamily II DNA or RNA helicase
MITINEIDSVNLKIDCDRSIAKEISSFFTFTVPNYQYTPAFKNKLWDGKIRLFNTLTHTIYSGLTDYVFKFAEERNYKIQFNPLIKPTITEQEIDSFLESFSCFLGGEKIQPHEHQIKAVKHALLKQRTLLISPTGSGKSLIIYLLIRFLLNHIPEDKKVLVIVPTTGLVAQMFNDFKEYSNKDGFIKSCHVLYEGQDKQTNKKIVISTWQSIYKLKEEYFKDFYCVFGDECHLFKAKSLTAIMSKMKTCPYRIGTTGTLDGTHVHKLVIEGLFGPVYNVTSTKTLIDKNLLANLKINCLLLQYTPQEVDEIKRAKYIEEIQWLVANKKRNKFIVNLCTHLKGNTLVLFNFVEKHGLPLFNDIEKVSKKPCFLIYGKTEAAEREDIRQIVNNQTDCILVASYGTCSTGINIKNIHNIVFTSPSKSVVRVLQSIGRGLRKSESKEKVVVYDIGDDLKHKKYRNHALRHMDDRINIYTNEKFSYSLTSIRLEDFE